MIFRAEIVYRRARNWLNRSEWARRLLRYPRSQVATTRPGIVLIQIDGLAYHQLQHALDKKRMPFLQHLLTGEDYQLRSLYSGLPSSTPAIQAELFYGIKSAVPAFSFVDRAGGKVIRMYDPGPTARIERELEQHVEPLLKGGVAYADVFTGGAGESHYCPSTQGWGAALRAANPIALLVILLTNAFSFIRISVLLVLETLIALYDCITGMINGRDLVQELKFVPTRTAICILLRELVTIGAKIDVARGMPIIHVNFLGYDEQSHRRGPSSNFAHWSLKGIDDAVARIWRAAQHSPRHYDVWIYSDHGQINTVAYSKRFGQSIQQSVADVIDKVLAKQSPSDHPHTDIQGIQSQRVRLLGGHKIQKLFPVYRDIEELDPGLALKVVAMGPLGMVYLPGEPTLEERTKIAAELVRHAHIPLVITKKDNQCLLAWMKDKEGEFSLPVDREKIFGAHHPFLDTIVDDLFELMRHRDIGDLVLSGWYHGIEPVSFVVENGSHAGFSPEETGAFALLPVRAPTPNNGKHYLRPCDLRDAAMAIMQPKATNTSLSITNRSTRKNRTVRVMTYNVHRCLGMDGIISPERIARVIDDYSPDIIALQELDVRRLRSGSIDQAHRLAQILAMDFHFHPTVCVEEELYGDAILTHLPMRVIQAGGLQGLPNRPDLEPRGAIWVAIDVDGLEVQFVNTHLGLRPRERLAQIETLLGPQWLAHPACTPPILFAGDFNALPSSPVCKKILQRFNDAQIELEHHRPRATLLSRFPIARIDHVFADPSVEILNIDVPKTALTRVASDHLPLIVDVRLSAV